MLNNRVKFLFEKKIYDNLISNSLINENEIVVFGLSGGIDSVSLLFALNEISKKLPFKIIAVHINHMIRNNAERDEKFSYELGKNMNIQFVSKKIDIPKKAIEAKQGIEETARQFRYQFFDEILKKYRANKIVTAHNKNDNAETVIFNLVRGSGLNGISGIALQRENIIRPMLMCSRKEIIEYATFNNLSYVTDETNFDTKYSRNFIRHEIMPLFEKQNPEVIDNIYNLSQNIRYDIEYINSVASDEREVSADLPQAILTRKIINSYSYVSNKTLSFKHIKAIVDKIYSNQSAYISLPDNLNAVIENGKLSFDKHIFLKENYTEIKLNLGDNNFNSEYNIILSKYKLKDIENIYKLSIQFEIDFDKIKGDIFVRSRKEGDKILLHTINRSIKKIFIDKKIKKEKRNNIPIICDNEGIICVPYVGVSDRVFNKNANNAIFIYILGNELKDEE